MGGVSQVIVRQWLKSIQPPIYRIAAQMSKELRANKD
jgi:hypothetical protein